MQIRTLLPIGTLALVAGSCAFAQTPAPAAASNAGTVSPSAAPVATIKLPGSGEPAVAPPVPQQGSVPSAPAYGQQTGTAGSVPAAVPVNSQALIAPAQPTEQQPLQAMPPYVPYGSPDEDKVKLHYGSTYIPVDSWVYPAMARLYGMGFADTMFLGMRPWTRQSVLHIIEETQDSVSNSNNDEAQQIVAAIKHELTGEETNGLDTRGILYGTKEVYDRVLGISGQTLRDSYHLGETIGNDYGRPYQPGFNNILGFHTLAEWGRLSLDVRGEYQHAAAGTGYSQALAAQLSQGIAGTNFSGDGIPYSGYNLHQPTIPAGPIPAANPFRLIEATLSFHLLGNEISGGKSDAWLGPAQGGALAWSNNADNIYAFRIDRVEPLRIPLLSRLTGPFRYDFFYGDLKGHTAPNDDWVHSEIASFRPTKNLEFSFQRTVVFGGKGHEPVTLHTFLKGFFSVSDETGAEKYSRTDSGARFGAFAASWRLPYLEKYATLYVDSEAHDDVSPISAPRRAAYRTGVYLSQFAGLRKLDFRIEGVTTDPGVARSFGGQFNYFEGVQQQAYTNEGVLFGDPIGREAKGGNAWLTYHLSGNEWVQVSFLTKKNTKDFIEGLYNPATKTLGPGGTTQNQFKIDVLKRFNHDNVELHAWYQHEAWKAQMYLAGLQSDNVIAFQATFFPVLRRVGPHLGGK